MRDQEDQMDHGSIGRTRGQGHVRIPQRRITRSLRTGVSPSMQPTAGNGQFQNGVNISPRVQPIRQFGPARGRMFQQFMNRATNNKFQQARGRDFQGAPLEHHQGANGGNPFQGGRNAWKTGWNGGRPPTFGHPAHPPTAGGNHNPFQGGRNAWQGGQPPIGPVGQPILGHGQTMNGMIQAIMGDLGQGINPDQFANMQAGNLPGGEHGDFLRALGGGAMNNSPLQALISHLVQGAAGADGTPGNYMINGDQGGDIAHILRQAIRNNPSYNPPRPPNGLFPPRPGGGRRGQQYMPAPIPLGIPQAGMPR